MKTIITLVTTVLFCVTTAYSQQAQTPSQNNCEQHRILTYIGMGYNNSIYSKFDPAFIQGEYSLSAALEAKYAWFFDPKWGISLGVGLSHFWAKGTLNSKGIVNHYGDRAFDPGVYPAERFYNLYYESHNLSEKQFIWAIEIPLQFHFEHKFDHKYGIFAGLGARAWLPVSGRSTFSDGYVNYEGYEQFNDAWYRNHHFQGENLKGALPARAKLNWSVDAIADFGGTMKLSDAFDLYVGLYGSYGFMDVLPDAADKKDFITPGYGHLINVNSLLASNVISEYNERIAGPMDWEKATDKWNRWQIGVKVGLHLKPCNLKYKEKGKSYRQVKKDFYEKFPETMSKVCAGGNSSQTIILRDTIHIVYVYPEKEVTKAEKDDIDGVIATLNSGKILFDLDKDIPKINDKRFIYETAKLLQKNPNLSVEVEGYTCDLGTEKHNRDLAARRANAIRNQFIAEGVNPSQIHVAAYTTNDPQNKQNIADSSRAGHRAVIFRVLKSK